jgi:hypothetical protein
MRLSNGRVLRRKTKDGQKTDWQRATSTLRIPMPPVSYLELEELGAGVLAGTMRDDDVQLEKEEG